MPTFDSSAAGLTSLGAILCALTVVFVALRFWARSRQTIPLSIDDWLMLAGSLAFVATVICVFVGLQMKILGYAAGNLTKQKLVSIAETWTILQISINTFSIVCLACTKASALFFYKRMFCHSGGSRAYGIIVIATIVVVACWMVAFVVLGILQCGTHFAAIRNGQYKKYCSLSDPSLYGLAISDVLLDLWLLCLPLPKIFALQATLKAKISVAAIFLIGLGAFAASLTRMGDFISSLRLNEEGYRPHDPELSLSRHIYYTVLEAGLSSLAINMISLWPLFSKTAPKVVLRAVRNVRSGREKAGGARSLHSVDGDESTHEFASKGASAGMVGAAGGVYDMTDLGGD